ncbi:Hypothetical predicted protein [Mytilus galloprovincialis]|uniref:THAP-type domain-containing protein n=1 Tax=Mytilus galloprovincialis TaxID=29158 RepID=A0A8B6F8L9_MYTGA|nr:Hypothetical predicted protein [Mytilus galloprovincialis]
MVNFHCIAEGCSNDSRKKHNAVKYPDMILNGCIVDFHVLPSVIKNPKLRKLWLSQIRREGFNPDPNCHWHALCSRHFIEGRPTKENAVPTLFAYNNYKTGTPRDTKNSTLRPIEQLILTTQPANIVTVSQLPKVPRQKKYIPDIPVISYIEKPSLDHTYCTSTEVSEDVSIEEKCVILIENSNTLEQKCQRYETDNNQLRKQVKLLQVELHATKEENKVLNEKFNNTDELLKDKLVEKLTKSNSNVKCFLGLPNFNLTKTSNVEWHGVGGRTIHKMIKFDLGIVKLIKSDCVVLLTGGNDVVEDTWVEEVAYKLISFCSILTNTYGVRQVVLYVPS